MPDGYDANVTQQEAKNRELAAKLLKAAEEERERQEAEKKDADNN